MRQIKQELSAWRRRSKLRQPAQRRALARMQESDLLFVHIPKCGGKSVQKALYGLDQDEGFGHATIDFYRALLGPARFRRMEKLAVVRDPVERCLSAFRFSQAGGFGLPRDRALQERLDGLDFDSFVTGPVLADLVQSDVVFRPQHFFVFDADGHCPVERLIPLERLGDVLAQLRLPGGARPDLPHLNPSPGSVDQVGAATRQQVREIYDSDYQYFGRLPDGLRPDWAQAVT